MPEVQDIFRQYGEEYLENHNVPYHLFKTMKAIEHCRTAELGAHVDYCEDCGNVLHVSYNSCRNRHCPKCQALPKWAMFIREQLPHTKINGKDGQQMVKRG